MYGFCLACSTGLLRWLMRGPCDADADVDDVALVAGPWTPESSYRFWDRVAQGFVSFTTAGFLVLSALMLVFRPAGTAEGVGLFALATR